MTTVSFFCTRCRRLTTFPASRRGAIVYCPRCQQALIVPDIPTSGDDGKEETIGEAWESGEFGRNDGKDGFGDVGQDNAETEDRGGGVKDVGFNGAAPRRFGATIASHLSAEKKRPENWRRLEAEAASGWEESNGERDDASLLTRAEVSDAEFLRRLRSEPQSQAVVKPPVAPPVLWDETSKKQETADVWGIPKFVWGAVGVATLGSAFVVGAFWAGNAKNDGDVSAAKQEVARETIFVEGALTYRAGDGTNAPDDGALVFLFPDEERWDAPLTLGDVSPQRPNPPGVSDVVADLEARGGRFAVADFEGRFAFDALEPGEYRVLLVSRRVGDDWGKANPRALKEIERCVVAPRLLLGRNRFFWTTRRFDRDAATLEKSFGKAGAPFSNVE